MDSLELMIAAGMEEASAGKIAYGTALVLARSLGWDQELDALARGGEDLVLTRRIPSLDTLGGIAETRVPYGVPSPAIPVGEWHVGMASGFRKAIANLDRKLLGRVMLAVMELTVAPVTVRGDTVKPLTGDLKGFWRYRLGEHRLIYSPKRETFHVTLLALEARGSAYKD